MQKYFILEQHVIHVIYSLLHNNIVTSNPIFRKRPLEQLHCPLVVAVVISYEILVDNVILLI